MNVIHSKLQSFPAISSPLTQLISGQGLRRSAVTLLLGSYFPGI